MPEPIDEWSAMPLLMTVEEAARVLRGGRSKAYAMAAQYTKSGGLEGLPVLRMGDLLRVPRPALCEYVNTGRVVQLIHQPGDGRAFAGRDASQAESASVRWRLCGSQADSDTPSGHVGMSGWRVRPGGRCRWSCYTGARHLAMVRSVEAGDHGHLSGAVTRSVAILLTDMVGSTSMWQRHSESMPFVLTRHHQLVEGAVVAHDGWLPVDQGEGDARLGVFEGAGALTRAARAAVAARAALAEERWPGGVQVRIRAAVDAGEVLVHNGNVFGTVVNRCARLRGLAHPGQTLAGGVGDAEAVDVCWTRLGAHRLRDVPDPVEVHQVDLLGGGVERFPPLSSALTAKAPPVIDGFTGRSATLDRLAASMGVGRVVSLTAPGGTGKTTVAVAAAHRAIAGFPGGVVFVDLAAVTEGADVGTAVALAAGCLDSGTPPWDSILGASQAGSMLLVLDNCEQISGLGRVLDEQRRELTNVAWLVTSRIPVGVPGETVIALEPLSTPSGLVNDEQALTASPAGALILQRARGHRPSLTLDGATAAHLAAITVLLDGHPLGLELAAARFRFQSVASVRQALESTLDGLVDTTGRVERRQQDLTAVLAWSVDHLEPSARHVLDILSVFEGPATFAAVADVAQIAEAATFAPMTDLLNAGLARAVADDGTEPRFALLVPVREHVRRTWSETQRTDLVERHARYHFRWAEHGSRTKHNTEADLEWLAETLIGRADALVALDHLEATDPDTALQCALHLNTLWVEHNDPERGAQLMTRLLERTTNAVEEFRLAARLSLSWFAIQRDPASLTQLLTDVRAHGSPRVEVMVLQECALVRPPSPLLGEPRELQERSAVLTEQIARAEAAGEAPFCGWVRAAHLTYLVADGRRVADRWIDPASFRRMSETGLESCGGPQHPMFQAWLCHALVSAADSGDLSRTRELAGIFFTLPFGSNLQYPAHMALAQLAVREGRLDDAVRVATDNLARSGNLHAMSAELLMIAVDALLLAHQPGRALDLLDQYPPESDALSNATNRRRARVLYELGRTAEAEAQLDQCEPSTPPNEASPSVLTYHLTRALVHDGERRQAHLRAYDELVAATGVVPWPRDAADRERLA